MLKDLVLAGVERCNVIGFVVFDVSLFLGAKDGDCNDHYHHQKDNWGDSLTWNTEFKMLIGGFGKKNFLG